MAIGRLNIGLTGVQPGGLAKVIPSSVAVGSGSGSSDSNGTVTFSGVSSISLNGCFNSSYQNYRIVANVTGSTTTALNLRFRASGTDQTTNYYGNTLVMLFTSTATTGVAQNNGTFIQLPAVGGSANFVTADIGNPQTSGVRTSITNQGMGGDNYWNYGSHLVDQTTSYDGVTIYPSSGTISGTIRVYGYTN